MRDSSCGSSIVSPVRGGTDTNPLRRPRAGHGSVVADGDEVVAVVAAAGAGRRHFVPSEESVVTVGAAGGDSSGCRSSSWT